MFRKLDSVSRYSPGNCDPEFLESILVGKHQLVAQLEKDVVDGIQTGAGHHWLLIGPRGVGKTHLLAILYSRIDDNASVRNDVVIAYMKEEERGVASFLDWVVRILRALERRGESNGQLKQSLVELTQMPLDQALRKAQQLLLHFVGDKKLLLIAENLSDIFSEDKGMGRQGQDQFRDLIQQNPFWIIMASAQSLFEDIQVREAPFYGFFKVEHLRMLSFEEAVELLEKLAASEQRDSLKRFFRSESGQGRIRAIHQITDGNPRLLVIFYQCIDSESMHDLASSFLGMVEDLTPFFQEQMGKLSGLQQKIVEYLCEHRFPATVKEIAQSCFTTHQSAANQLKRLLECRVVQTTRVGRESHYELREPLLRICFEVKENMGYPIRLFIDFLGKFYSIEELKRKHRNMNLRLSLHESHGARPEASKLQRELAYIEEALSAYHTGAPEDIGQIHAEGDQFRTDHVPVIVEELIAQEDYRDAVRLADTALEYGVGGAELLLKSAIGHRKLGDLSEALEILERVTEAEPGRTEAWIEIASVHQAMKDQDAAERSFRRALEIDATNVDALIGLGVIYGNKGDDVQAHDYFHRAIQSAPEESRAWLNLGLAHKYVGDVVEARTCYLKATELAPENADAWLHRGAFEMSQGEYATEMSQGEHATALECFQHVTQLQPDNAVGWLALGQAQENTGDLTGARVSYIKATELAPEDADAWLYRGRFEGNQGEYAIAFNCLERVLSLGRASADIHNSMGEYLREMHQYKEAIAQYQEAIALDPGECFPHFNIALAQFQSGNLDAGMQQLRLAVEAGQDRDWNEGVILCVNDITVYLLCHTPKHLLMGLLEQQRTLFREGGLSESFSHGLIGAITELIKQHEGTSLERLDQLRQEVISELAQEDEFRVVGRLFDTGVRYLQSQDRRVLLELPLEERRSLEKLLGQTPDH